MKSGCWESRSAAPSCNSGSVTAKEAWSRSNGCASIPPEAHPGFSPRFEAALPILLDRANLSRHQIQAVGIGFGGPVDASRGRTQTSYQVGGWDDFPLASWISGHLDVPRVVVENDADTAGLAEARFGAGVGHSPLLYMNVGSGIGGALIVDQQIYRGFGQGATEVGHLRVIDVTTSGLGSSSWNKLLRAGPSPRPARTMLGPSSTKSEMTGSS